MSALAMILTAALAISGDGPEKVSGEMGETLDLSAEWEGTWESRDVIRAKLKHGIIRASGKLEDRLCGRCRLTFASEALVKVDYEGRAYHGIVTVHGPRVTLVQVYIA